MTSALTRYSKKALEFQTKDVELTDRYLSRTPFHPTYWSRVRRDGAIAERAHLASGKLLDVGCGVKPFEKVVAPFVTEYIGLEYSPESGYRGNRADVCGDAAYLPFADDSFDTILCSEVLEHVPDPELVISEFARVLKPGGVLITTAPFMFPIHDSHDYFRYTASGLPAMMKRSGLLVDEVKPLSGAGVTLAILFNLYWYSAGFMWTKWLYPIGLVLRPLLWLGCLVVNVLGGIGERLVPAESMSFNYLTVARK